MYLSEVFDQLTYGELAQLSLGTESEPGISAANQSKVLASINMGLTELHKRFLLREGEVTIPVTAGIFSYSLATVDDLIKVERVYCLEDGEYRELMLNASNETYLLEKYYAKTPSYKVVMISPELITTELKVVYRATVPPIEKTIGYFNPADVVVDLPYSHLEALLYYVASRIMNPIGMVNTFHDGNNFAAKFEQSCMVLEMQNLRIDTGSTNTRLERNGWV